MDYCTKAVVVKAFGSYNCLSVEKFALPPATATVEVEVVYCGMNFADLYIRQGLMTHLKPPFVLGIECAGIVKNIYDLPDCKLKIGDRVLCYDYNGGLHRDVIRISPDKCYLLPDDIGFDEGAALFVNYLTAYFALFELGHLKPNESVLIQSCAGGVGVAATQLAKTVAGVEVTGTTSPFKVEAAKFNGVDHVINYEDISKQGQFDVIIDNQAGKTFSVLQDLLKPLGRIILTGANSIMQNNRKLSSLTLLKAWWNMKNIAPATLLVNNRAVSGLHLGVLAEKEPTKVENALHIIFGLVKDGKIKPIIDSVWPVEDVVSAAKVLGERKNVGKVLISMANSPKVS